MKEYYTNVGQSQYDTSKGRVISMAKGSEVCGTVLMARATMVVASAMAVNDVVNLVHLPPGAVVVPHLCRVACEACGTTLTVTVGDKDDPDRYSGSLTLSAAADLAFAKADGGLNPVVLDRVDGKGTWIRATITGASALAAGKRVQWWIAYTVN